MWSSQIKIQNTFLSTQKSIHHLDYHYVFMLIGRGFDLFVLLSIHKHHRTLVEPYNIELKATWALTSTPKRICIRTDPCTAWFERKMCSYPRFVFSMNALTLNKKVHQWCVSIKKKYCYIVPFASFVYNQNQTSKINPFLGASSPWIFFTTQCLDFLLLTLTLTSVQLFVIVSSTLGLQIASSLFTFLKSHF